MPVEVLVTVPFSEKLINQLSAISPKINLTAISAQKASEIPAEVWAQTEVLYTGHVIPEPNQAQALRWIQFHFAGIDRYLDEPLLQREDVLVTTLSGAAAPQVAEYALTMMLALGHKLPALMTAQKKPEWPKDRFERFLPFELNGKTVGIVGYGSIGRQIARLLQPFGVTILATKRNGFNPTDEGYVVEGTGDPQGDFVHRLYPPQALRSMIKECHFIVVTVPMTLETKNMVNAAIFDSLKPGAFLIDVSRGGVVNHNDLTDAIKNNKLAGAALDVFPEEPLPSKSPLWQNPNIIISPHISGGSEQYNERAAALFSENMLRYLSGLHLYNVFDRKRGY
jgi:phosphoglycerate dehydrogenase-like enzyme